MPSRKSSQSPASCEVERASFSGKEVQKVPSRWSGRRVYKVLAAGICRLCSGCGDDLEVGHPRGLDGLDGPEMWHPEKKSGTPSNARGAEM
jgi:hypothetical protein